MTSADVLRGRSAPVAERGRIAVEWYVPGTMIGDGRPLNGVTFYDGTTPSEAWDRFELGHKRPNPMGEVVIRSSFARDLRDLRPLREVIDAQRLR